MKYKINWIEVGNLSTGKTKADVSVIDASGTEQGGITIWSDFPNFSDLKAGSEVEGDVIVKQSGKYTNKTLYPPRTNTLSKPVFSGFKKETKSEQIANAQERKAEYIEEAQKRKDASIAFFNSTNSAIAFVSAFMKEVDPLVAFEEVIKVRDRFLDEWSKWEATPLAEKTQPF